MLRVVEVLLDPVGGDECGVAAHGVPFVARCGPGRLAGGSGCGVSAGGRGALEEEVHLAAEAEAEGRVEERRGEREPGGDGAEQVERRRGSRRARPARSRGRRPGRTAAGRRPRARRGGAEAGPDERAEQPGVRRALDAAERADREQRRLGGEQRDGDGDGREQQRDGEHAPWSASRRTAGRAGRCCGARRRAGAGGAGGGGHVLSCEDGAAWPGAGRTVGSRRAAGLSRGLGR